jgi:protoheme IX farnesyltransferase
VDRSIDEKMARTANRPIAQGRLQPNQANHFALIIGLAGIVILVLFTNILTAWLTLASSIGYAFIYTYVFKARYTAEYCYWRFGLALLRHCLGWVAVTGEIHYNALLLVLIIFVWTPPHFWALALHRKEEYAKADIPMLPVTHGDTYTKINILLYTLMLIVVTIMPI